LAWPRLEWFGRDAYALRRRLERAAKGAAALSTDQVLAGLGLIIVLAVGSQVLASQLRIPALIILLPAGFTAGAITSDVNPERLVGPAFHPLVSLFVAVILYNAGLGLDLSKGTREHVVRRLVVLGVPITAAFAAAFAALLFGMSSGAAIMIGAILVVSGPTVVEPLLRFVRPTEHLGRLLDWEGSLIDPVGGVLGSVVFAAVVSVHHGVGYQVGRFALSIAIGVAGAAIGTAVLWLCLVKLKLGRQLATITQLACVVGIAAACDILRDDSGLIAAILMGLALANLGLFAALQRDQFFDTLVQLLIGLLFVSISATVTPSSLQHVLLATLGLVAVLVLVTRPLVAFIATLRSGLNRGERAFVGWMAPRGIVAAATASTFAPALVKAHVGGATKILPVTFLVIVATVAIYGLSAVPVARLLGVSKPARASTLIVGGEPWVIDLARALRHAGVDVLSWAHAADQRQQIERAGLELAPGEALTEAVRERTELEQVSAVLLLTGEDAYNALASTVVEGQSTTPVYHLAPRHGSDRVGAPDNDASATLFSSTLTHDDITQRYRAGSRVTSMAADGAIDAGSELLFLIDRGGHLRPVTASDAPTPEPGDTVVVLGVPTG
jgi:NhaP-type Na+/H+ or K+/H+ antiporter